MSNRPNINYLEAKSAANRRAWQKEPVASPPPLVRPLTAEHGGGGGRANKFGAIKSSEGDSRKEVKRLQELRLLQAAGQISKLIPQVRYQLIPAQRKEDGTMERAVHYTADFQYISDGNLIIEDVKSPPTRAKRDYVICRKLMKELYGIEILET